MLEVNNRFRSRIRVTSFMFQTALSLKNRLRSRTRVTTVMGVQNRRFPHRGFEFRVLSLRYFVSRTCRVTCVACRVVPCVRLRARTVVSHVVPCMLFEHLHALIFHDFFMKH